MQILLRNRTLCRRVKEFAKQANCSPAVWVTQALEEWIAEHRSNRFAMDQTSYDARNEDESLIYDAE